MKRRAKRPAKLDVRGALHHMLKDVEPRWKFDEWDALCDVHIYLKTMRYFVHRGLCPEYYYPPGIVYQLGRVW
jgi:hypothetical protein